MGNNGKTCSDFTAWLFWIDVFQKIKANGFNTVSFCVNWALHYPTPDAGGGEGDWQEGTYRDIQRFIDEAKAVGLWLIVRYISHQLLTRTFVDRQTLDQGHT